MQSIVGISIKFGSSINLINQGTGDGLTVAQTFRTMWDARKGACPTIDFLFSIENNFLKKKWQRYRDTLEDTHIEVHFHGTKLNCNITDQKSLCNDTECGICNISDAGLDRRFISRNIAFQRFGYGFYVAPNSSKCHDYTQGKHGYRAMILLDVLPGKKYELKRDDECLKEPPSGYNSVHGKSRERMNYDELVLYNPDSACPKCIIVYKRSGEKKMAQ